MERTTYEGFYANELFDSNGVEKIATARNGEFYNGYTEMRMTSLVEGVEGANLVLDIVMKELVKHKEALREGRQVNVYVNWTLSEDRTEYTSCNLIKTEYGEKFGN